MKSKIRFFVPVLVLLAGLFIWSCEKSLDDFDTPPAIGATENMEPDKDRRIADPTIVEDNIAIRIGQASERRTVLKKKSENSVVVDDDGAQCPDAQYTTIQDAVDSGAEIIHICEGTYSENVVIVSDVKIFGAGKDVTIITGPNGNAGPFIDVIGPDIKVDIKNLTVDGNSMTAGGTVFGIRYTEASGYIQEVAVLNIRNASGGTQGIGIGAVSAGSDTKLKIQNTMVSNYTRVGIYGNGAGVELSAQKNQVMGPLEPRVWAPNGIQISRGAAGDLVNNDVDNNPSPNPPGGAGSGIILLCAGKTNINGNNIADADLGITVADNQNADIHNNHISDSQFEGISLQFIGFYYGIDLGCGITPVENNSIQNNHINNSTFNGISLANYDVANAPDTPNNNSVNNNVIDGSGDEGIHVYDGADNDFKNQKILNSTGDDIADDTSGGGTAGTANHYKNNQCSSSTPAGLCK